MRTVLTLLTLLFITVSYAKPVDPNTAAKAGQNFLNYKVNSPNLGQVAELKIAYQASSAATNPLSAMTPVTYYYVFNAGSNGYVIVAGDDNVTPVLGYSDQGTFDPNNIPQNAAKWLEGYKLQIRDVIERHIPATETITKSWNDLLGSTASGIKRGSVSPLMATRWNQSPYYNAMCPGGSVTGCVATAMAQVMKYWNYPTTGTGFHSYNHSTYGTLSANFGSTTYQWSSMPNSVTSSNSAVATLMYQVGVSVDMNYSPQSSGAYVITSKSPVTNCSEYAFKTYFGYNDATGVERENYSDAQWLALLKTELDASRPVLYAGFGSGGGHCFVADGYDNSDYVHFNWGWAGAYDGYFSIDALNPSGTGTGGGAGGYNSGHQAVINIKPPSGGTTDYNMVLYDYVTPSASSIYFTQSFSVSANFYNKGTSDFNGDFAAAVFDNNYKFVDFVETKTGYSLQAGYVFQNDITFSTQGLVSMLPGTYYVGVFYRPTGGNWIQVGNYSTYTNLVQMQVTNTNTIALSKTMDVTPTTLTQGKNASVNLNIVNNSGTTFTGQYQVNLYDLQGTFVETIGTINENNGLPDGYTYTSPYLTFTSSAIGAAPGTYLLAVLHKSSSGSWQLTGTGSFQNPIKIDVKEPGMDPDQYEPDNTVQTAYDLNAIFSNNQSKVTTAGSNCHVTTDVDYYKVILPAGFDYTITPRLHDSYNSGNGNTYTVDALFSYSTDGNSWSDAYDNYMPNTITVTNGGTLYFKIAPYFAGETGTYQFDITSSRVATHGSGIAMVSAADFVKVYPNPASDFISVDLHAFEGTVDHAVIENAEGQTVMNIDLQTGEKLISIRMDGLSEGIYFLRLSTGEGLITKKITLVK